MIRLTTIDGPVYVAPEQIKMISSHACDANVTTVGVGRGHFANVTESPEEVSKKVLEYKLAMEDFKACLMNSEVTSTAQVEKRLQQLAGLEATQ